MYGTKVRMYGTILSGLRHNYYNKDVLRSSTLRGYATAVKTLFQLRGYKQPTELSNPSNMLGIIINNLIKEETVASQCSPLDSTIFAELE